MTIDKKHTWAFESPIDLTANPTYTTVVARPTSRKECEEALARSLSSSSSSSSASSASSPSGDGGGGGGGGHRTYGTFGELVKELRSVYTNALAFNAGGEKLGNKV
jgi:hypothetical protein